MLRGDGGELCGLAAISSQRCASIEVARCTAKADFKAAAARGAREVVVEIGSSWTPCMASRRPGVVPGAVEREVGYFLVPYKTASWGEAAIEA